VVMRPCWCWEDCCNTKERYSKLYYVKLTCRDSRDNSWALFGSFRWGATKIGFTPPLTRCIWIRISMWTTSWTTKSWLEKICW
jgi:hypothetical protein